MHLAIQTDTELHFKYKSTMHACMKNEESNEPGAFKRSKMIRIIIWLINKIPMAQCKKRVISNF